MPADRNNKTEKEKFVNPWRKSLPSLPQKSRFRTLKRAILILLVFLFLVIAVPRLYSEISFRWQYRDLIAQEKAYERDYIKYSGKTPQEVYEKYVSALKRGDIDEAIKYYRDQRDAKNEKEYLEKLKAENKLEEEVNSFPKWEELKEEEFWNKDVKKFVHKYVLEQDRVEYDEWVKQEYVRPAGVYNDFVIAFFNDSSKKFWKLYDL